MGSLQSGLLWQTGPWFGAGTTGRSVPGGSGIPFDWAMADYSWHPTKFVRFEETIGTSTRPARIVTDVGPAFIKALNNPLGPDALVREYVGTSLARWLGLDTFDFGLMQVLSDDEIPLGDGKLASPGTAFATRVTGGHTWDGSSEDLDLIDNPEAIALVVAFDTWTLNSDRHPAENGTRKPNPDNVFLTSEGATPGRFRLLAFDHTECFGGTGRELTKAIARIGSIKDPKVYGLFPAFVNRIGVGDLQEAANRLSGLKPTTVEGFVTGIPAEWDATIEVRAALCELVFERARYLAENLVHSVSEACGKLAL